MTAASRRRSVARGHPWAWLAPAVIALTLVQLLPMLAGIAMSLTRLTQYTISNWTSAPRTVHNFDVAYGAGPIRSSLVHSFLITLLYAGLVVAGSWVLGMAAAVFAVDSGWGSRVFRAVYLLPYAIPAFAGIQVWATSFQPHGAVDALFGDVFHLVSPDKLWLASGNSAFVAMTVTALWRSWPFAFLMLLATVQSIPTEQYEAAEVDGASQWQMFRDITLPGVRPVSRLVLLVIGFWTFNDFATPYLMFGASTPESANLISSNVYTTSFTNLNFGLGAAMSMGVIVFMLVVAVVYVRVMREELARVFTI